MQWLGLLLLILQVIAAFLYDFSIDKSGGTRQISSYFVFFGADFPKGNSIGGPIFDPAFREVSTVAHT